jgi:Fe2+ or Zn2+ uptake regulation protein
LDALIDRLRDYGIQATPQRLAVAEFVLFTGGHPSADEVWEEVRLSCPTLSRATVYNTLNLFVARGLLKTQQLRVGTLVFDPHVEAHHHLIDEETGEVFDVPWGAVRVEGERDLSDYEIREYQVVLRGRKRKS